MLYPLSHWRISYLPSYYNRLFPFCKEDNEKYLDYFMVFSENSCFYEKHMI